MNYMEAVEYIEQIPKFTTKNKPEHTTELLHRLGSPQKNQKVIHVAGTNGKGSVCAFISSILKEAGKKAGLFTSPHLERINERFMISGEMVSDENFLEVFLKVKQVVDGMLECGLPHPTFFEYLFAMSMLLFEMEQVEFAILETGLGGRLDATNVIECPVITIITSIGLDHTEILGETISEIASEKAGIIKAGVPVIVDGNNLEAYSIIEKRAAQMGSECIKITKQNYKVLEKTDKNIDFSANLKYYEGITFHLPFVAPYQIQNAVLALAAVWKLSGIAPEIAARGIEHARWAGRMEQVLPNVFIDGAHNEAGIKAFAEAAAMSEYQKPILLFTAVKEKDYESMLQIICNQIDYSKIIITEFDNPRALEGKKLLQMIKRYTDSPVELVSNLEEAFFKAVRETNEHRCLYCIGSLYLAGAIKEIVRRKYDD